jgi:hypothetical protein
MKSGFLKFLFAAAIVACLAPTEKAHAAWGSVYCAPDPGVGSPGPRRVVNPVTTTAYSLNAQGCAFIANADIGYFLSQGYTSGPNSQNITMVGLTANSTTANSPILPAGATIDSIVIGETAGNAVTGGVDIGTAASGAQIVAAVAAGANSLATVAASAILLRVFGTGPLPAAQQIFYTCHTGCNSSSINISISYHLF